MGRKSNELSNLSKSERNSVIQQRKRARRDLQISLKAAETLLSSDSLTDKQKEQISNYKTSIEETLRNSYSNKKGGYNISTSALENRASAANELAQSNFDSENLRKNKIFTRDINQASLGGVSTKTKEEVKVFYAATKDIWDGKDITERHNEILKYFGVETIAEAWDIVMQDENVKKALDAAKKAQEKVKNDKDISDGTNEPQDEIGSPIWIKDLILTNDTKQRYAQS